MIPTITTIVVVYAATRLVVAAFQYAASPGVSPRLVALVSVGVGAAVLVMGFCLAGVYSMAGTLADFKF